MMDGRIGLASFAPRAGVGARSVPRGRDVTMDPGRQGCEEIRVKKLLAGRKYVPAQQPLEPDADRSIGIVSRSYPSNAVEAAGAAERAIAAVKPR
jgi:hypothetical protein